MSRKLGMPSTGAAFEIHRQPLHAEVGRDDDAGEVARVRHAGDGDRLRAERFFHLLGRAAQRRRAPERAMPAAVAAPAAGLPASGSIEQLMPLRVRRFGDAERDHQVVEREHRPAARGADDAAHRIHTPAFGRTGEHDVLLLRIHEHVFHALQAGEEANGIGDRLAGRVGLGNFRFQLPQRDEPQIGPLFQIGRHFLQALLPGGLQLFQLADFRVRDDAVDIDLHAADRAASERTGRGTMR